MHYYACPYCLPSKNAVLLEKDTKNETWCSCDVITKWFGTREVKECGGKGKKCKKILRCKKCQEEWVITKEFLSNQKRKIKDG
jgi:hypothetical protein